MNRLVFLFMLLSAVGSCDKIDNKKEPQSEYALHNDFYYSSSGEKIPLELCDDEFYIVVKKSSFDDAMGYLASNDFTLTREVEDWEDWKVWGIDTEDPDYVISPSLADCVVTCIKGTGNVDDIPGLVYSSNKYLTNGEVLGITNILHVKYDSEKNGTDIERLKEIAEELNVIPLAKITKYSSWYGTWYAMACTNDSVGNCLEIANYIYEYEGFYAYSQTFDTIVPEL